MKKSALKKYIKEEIIKALSESEAYELTGKTGTKTISSFKSSDEANKFKQQNPNITSVKKLEEKDEDINEETLDEGWKQALIGLGLTAATIAGIGKAYLPPSAEELKDRETLEKTVNIQKDALNRTPDKDVLQMVRSLEDFLNTSYLKFSPQQADRLGSEKMSSLMNQEARNVIEKLVQTGNDQVKAGFVIKSDGTLTWANPTQISPINEVEDDVEVKDDWYKSKDEDGDKDKEPSKSDLKKDAKATKGMAKAKDELAKLTKEMKALAKKYKEAKGADKDKIVADLKEKTKLKKELEAILDK
jgi:hypothetical protein